MYYVSVKIDDKPVDVPTFEIPALIKTLTDHHERLLASGALDAELREDYLSYDECKQILSVLHSDAKLRNHTGKLWGMMCRLTRRQLLHFNTMCTLCKGPVEQEVKLYGKPCHHNTGIIGYSSILITKRSILLNVTRVSEGTFSGVGPTIRADYHYLTKALAK